MSHPRLLVGLAVGSQPPLRRLATTVRAAHWLRVDSVWTVDHFTSFFPKVIWDKDFSWLARPGASPDQYFDYQTLTGYLARRVGRAQLGIGVTEPIRRHPLVIAQAALTLAHLTRRPPILGIGAGERENTEPYGLSFRQPVARLEEALVLIRQALNGHSLEHSGRFFRVEGGQLDLRPPKGARPQLWIAAHGPRMLRLAGRFGDGWFPTTDFTPERYADALASIRSAALNAGRDPQLIIPALQALVVVGPTEAQARQWLEARAIRFIALLAPHQSWTAAGVSHPLGAGFRGLVDLVPYHLSRAELEEAMAAVPTGLLARQAIWGTPAQVVAKLRALAEAGLKHVVLAPASGLISRRAAAFVVRALPGMIRRLRSGQ